MKTTIEYVNALPARGWALATLEQDPSGIVTADFSANMDDAEKPEAITAFIREVSQDYLKKTGVDVSEMLADSSLKFFSLSEKRYENQPQY
ncbi:MAG TPA: hypothetical protein EYQ50_16510 [Verrucomicrobiales bacterium]|nr:hypothetical protein [Verrucomicrobiales bacterium]